MSLPEIERRSRQRPKSLCDDDNAVLTFSEWCALNGFSPRTGRRILAGHPAERPIITCLSARRMGITRGNNRKWQESRAR
jgi:hypothetical protein